MARRASTARREIHPSKCTLSAIPHRLADTLETRPLVAVTTEDQTRVAVTHVTEGAESEHRPLPAHESPDEEHVSVSRTREVHIRQIDGRGIGQEREPPDGANLLERGGILNEDHVRAALCPTRGTETGKEATSEDASHVLEEAAPPHLTQQR